MLWMEKWSLKVLNGVTLFHFKLEQCKGTQHKTSINPHVNTISNGRYSSSNIHSGSKV